MPVIPTRFPVEFGDVFPFGAFVLGVEPSMAFSADPAAPKMQERDKETGQLVWIVRALDANEEAARFGAEFKVKVSADHQPVPPEKLPGFPFPPVEFEGLTITPPSAREKSPRTWPALHHRAPASNRRGSFARSAPCCSHTV